MLLADASSAKNVYVKIWLASNVLKRGIISENAIIMLSMQLFSASKTDE